MSDEKHKPKPRIWRPSQDPATKPPAAITGRVVEAEVDGERSAADPADSAEKSLADLLPSSWGQMRSFVDELRAKVEARDA
ncbi:MAG: hypothetical protein MUE69_04105, partial [Myxococcota bacterium]|nr:hypothetical protein [Myxococcota bacterium]